ncbi:MAG: YqeG family HAD IIIA-type phosphatase [Armatimonadetes bacterium]|nr:YqeG family HAD IIIA-type phosphatase [Armatimonadota bacterium]
MSLLKRLARSLAPDVWIESVCELTPQYLGSLGIKGLIVDLDNTLCEWQSEDIPQEVRLWLKQLQEARVGVCIASNTHNRRRLDRVAKDLGVAYVQGVPKPRRLCFSRAFELLDLPPESVAVAGDQMFTDVLGGKRSGIHTVMVKPIHRREFIGTRISRMVERYLISLFEKHGLWPRKMS